MSNPAIFLDRDGTLIEDRGALCRPEDVVFFPDTIPALKKLAGIFRLFIVTHQPAVARGELTAAEVTAVNTHIVQTLARHGIAIVEVYCCPHDRAEGCSCIKPLPHFLHLAARQYDIDLAASFTLGDHPPDVELGTRAGAQGIYLLSGHGRQHRDELPRGTVILPGIRAAADWILATHHSSWRSAQTKTQILEAAEILRAGGVAVFPTETVYGLGAPVFNESAIAKIFEVKKRPYFDPLIVHVFTQSQLAELALHIPSNATALLEQSWPGPLTVVLAKSGCVPDLVTAGLPTVAVRMPCHPVALELIRQVGCPVVAPSANRFGHLSPTSVEAARAELADLPDYYLDGGSCAVGIESTVISFTEESPTLLRPGGIAMEEIENIIGPVRQSGKSGTGPAASPGSLPCHYAPATRLRLWSRPELPINAARSGLLTLGTCAQAREFAQVEVLSQDQDLRAAAVNFFAALRRLDKAGLEAIYAVPVPELGLGRAINDRLRRAAARDQVAGAARPR